MEILSEKNNNFIEHCFISCGTNTVA